MRQRWALLWGLLSGLFVGCATEKPLGPSSGLERFRPFHGPTGSDVVLLDVALLEGPLGDQAINHDLWAKADEQGTALEGKSILEDNGFRVGQVGGMIPAELQTLLTSERSCVNPRRIQLHANNPTTLALGPPLSQCGFQLHQEGQSKPVALDQAQCSLSVLPTLTRDGHTRLQFTPIIQTGPALLMPGPNKDRSGWIWNEQRPTQRYSFLSWEVTLAPNEYVLVGARFDRPQTLGFKCFVRADEPAPVQRLLVIRTTRSSSETETASSPSGDDSSFHRSPPLALQAAWTSGR